MATIRVRLVDPETGEGISGRYELTPKPFPGVGPWVDGRDLHIPDTMTGTLLASEHAAIAVPVLPPGWYYHFEAWQTAAPAQWRATVDFLLPEDGDWDFEDLPTVDPCSPESSLQPEPLWWRTLRSVQDTLAEAVGDAEDAATRAEAAAIGGEGFSEDSDWRMLVLDADDRPVITHGDPDQITTAGVASITKILTCLIASETLDSLGESPNRTFTVVQADREDHEVSSPGNRIFAGDIIAADDLMRLCIMPSDNVAPVTLARGVGRLMRLDDGLSEGDEEQQYQAFIAAMNRYAADAGWGGASFTRPAGAGRMSARQVADLIRRGYSDTTLGPILGQQQADIAVDGSDPRTISIQWGLAVALPTVGVELPETLAYKGGTQAGRDHAAFVWDNGGEDWVSVALDFPLGHPPNNRITQTRRAWDLAQAGGGVWRSGYLSGSGRLEDSTGRLDITDLFAGAERTDIEDSGIHLQRSGNVCELSITQVVFTEGTDFNGVIPRGFRPGSVAYGQPWEFNNSAGNARGWVAPNGRLVMFFIDDESNPIRWHLTWITDDAFPTVPYPGIPRRRR